MGTDGVSHDLLGLNDYLQVLRRRKWVVAATAVLIPLVAVLLSLQQQPLYKASADVLLSQQNLAAQLNGLPSTSNTFDQQRDAQTQAQLAMVPTVAQRVLKATGITDRTPDELLGEASATASTDTNILTFSVTDPNPTLAMRLATSYAEQFTLFRRELDTASLERARTEVASRISVLKSSGEQSSALYADLVNKEQQLRTMEALETSNAFLVRSANDVVQVQPRPTRNGVLGLALGVVFGIMLAFLWEAVDTRLRSAEEISERLQLPLLARLPSPPKAIRNENGLVMLRDPTGIQAEAFRMLRTNLEFANLERGARTIMFTSAVEGEGKSTTVANLAIALARAGRHVILVDLDLRRPFINRFFAMNGHAGVTDVALGHVSLEEALMPVAITRPGPNGITATNGSGNGAHQKVDGILEVLPSGPPPPDAGEFVATNALASIIKQLRDRAEVVLIDAPPVLHVGDAMVMSAQVDGVIVVTRLKLLRRPLLRELRRVLDTSPAAKLGFVLTGADEEEGYGYGYGYSGYYMAPAPHPHDREKVS